MAITHLIVDNGNYSVTVANKVVKNLYDLVKALYAAVPNHTAEDCYIRGTIRVEHAHPSRVEFLEEEFGDLTITMTGDAYIESDNSAAISAMAKVGDGVGLTVAVAAGKTVIDDDYRGAFQGLGIVDASFFQYFTGLTITRYTFRYNDSLQNVVFPQNLTIIGQEMFGGCSSLTSIIIPSSVESIGSSAFSGTGLTSITIPQSVTNVSSYAFAQCTNLENVTFEDFDIAKTATAIIDNYAFSRCPNLSSVTIGNTVKAIRSYVFYQCTNLSSVIIGSSVKTIDSNAFNNCTALTNISIPSSVTKIGSKAFSLSGIYYAVSSGVVYADRWAVDNRSYYASSISLQEGTIGIADNAFDYLSSSNLTSVHIPNTVLYIGEQAFSGKYNLAQVDMGNAVISIGSNAFYGCSSLASIDIPITTTTIGSKAFVNCVNLTSLVLPGIVSAGNDMIRCGRLTYLEFGANFDNIDGYIVDRCTNLQTLVIRAENVPTQLSSGSFFYQDTVPTNLTIYVPDASVNAYKASPIFSVAADRIHGLSEIPQSSSE